MLPQPLHSRLLPKLLGKRSSTQGRVSQGNLALGRRFCITTGWKGVELGAITTGLYKHR